MEINEVWKPGSFLLEMKPKTEYASLFVGCPKEAINSSDGSEPFGMIRLEEQMLELGIDPHKHSSGSEDELEGLITSKKKFCTKLSDIILDPATVNSISWTDQNQELMMCKIKAEADYITFVPKTIKRLEEELIQMCHLREYVERIEHNKNFNVKCKQCGHEIHSNAMSEYNIGILPNDEWFDVSPQMDYFCGLSGSDCCAQHFEKAVHHHEGILTITKGINTEWLPDEKKILMSNSFIILQKNQNIEKQVKEHQIEGAHCSILSCSNCNVQIGTVLKNQRDIYKLHISVLDVYGENQQMSSYIPCRFPTKECFLAWMILNKCEQHSSMKLLIRSLDRIPQFLIWLLEPYVLLTKGTLKESPAEQSTVKKTCDSTVSFPALKILYKLFDQDTSKSDPRANGGDSSVGILEVPMGCCIELTECLLNSSLSLPPPLRALGQFYVGFLRLKDRID